MTPTLILAAARLAATRAADYAASQTLRRRDANKVSRSDVKHKLDVECQEIATQILLSAFPDSVILGEETTTIKVGEPPASAGLEWIIDPIDGTINFFHGLPYWCCSIAARLDGVWQAGVVYAPELGRCFEATCDGPALLNGVRISVSDTDDLLCATIHTGSDKEEEPSHAFRFFNAFATICQRPRVMGAAALDICAVAAGQCEAYFEHGVYIWDVAAAGLILERAGGVCDIMRRHGGYRMAFLATNSTLPVRNKLLAIITPLLGH